MTKVIFKIWRTTSSGGAFQDYPTEITEGMVVLDAVHQIQAELANDLAVRWNCKAGKCGSCSAEINGHPKLMCMTRMSDMPADQPVTLQPMKAFPVVKDLVTDVSVNYRMHRTAPGEWRKVISTAYRNSVNVLNVFFARMFVMYCANITCMNNLPVRGTWSTRRPLKCTRSM
jgi:succinate dehydrogenase/fumarate reductase-like Fe-S protein